MAATGNLTDSGERDRSSARRSAAARLARVAIFPLTLGLGLWATVGAMAQGLAPAAALGLGCLLAGAGVLGLLWLILLFIERLAK